MLSLAEMIEEGRAIPMNRGETKIDLYNARGSLGHSAAYKLLGRARKAIRLTDRALKEEIYEEGLKYSVAHSA